MIDLNRVIEAYTILSSHIKNDLNEEFVNDRITGSDYSTTYSQLMSVVLQLSFSAPEKDALVCQVKSQTENTARLTAKVDDDIVTTMLKIQLDAWAEAYKSGQLEAIPSILSDDDISSLYKSELDRVGSNKWRDETNQCYKEETTQGLIDV